MGKQQQVSRRRLRQKIGKRMEVINEERTEEGYLARSSADASVVGGFVKVATDQVLAVVDQIAAGL